MYQIKKARKPVETTKKWLKRNRNHHYNSQNYLHKLQKKKAEVAHQLGVPVNPNGSIKNKRQGTPGELQPISSRIALLQVKVNQFGTQIQRQLEKLERIIPNWKTARTSIPSIMGILYESVSNQASTLPSLRCGNCGRI